MTWWIMPGDISILSRKSTKLCGGSSSMQLMPKKWSNILSLVELLFCHPMANGRVERIFSQLKLIKTERHTCFMIDRLDSLLRIAVDAPRLSKWDASGAVQHWWGDKKCRKVKDTRAPPKRKEKAPDDHSDSGHEDLYTVTLDDWESWIL